MLRFWAHHSERTRRVAVLCCALGVGLIAYAVVSLGGDGDDETSEERSPATSEPSVLGAVVTPELPVAPAAPVVSLDATDATDDTTSPSTSNGAPDTTRTPVTAAPPPPTASTEPPPTLVPPTVIQNTTTTSTTQPEEPSTTTTEGGEQP